MIQMLPLGIDDLWLNGDTTNLRLKEISLWEHCLIHLY